MAKKQQATQEPAKKVSQKEMVRQALEAGLDKANDGGLKWIKDKFGADLTPNVFSMYKSQLRPKASKTVDNKEDGFNLETVKAVKETLDAHGIEAITASINLIRKYGVGGVVSALEVASLFNSSKP